LDPTRQGLDTGADRMETAGWSIQEFLLMELKVKIQSKTLRNVLGGWWLLKKQLKNRFRESFVPKSLMARQALRLSRYNKGSIEAGELRDLKVWCRSRSISKVEDWVNEDGSWKQVENLNQAVRSSREFRLTQARS
jgi:hypothetical protein